MTPTLAEVTRQLLISYNRFPRKSLGQHFLVDPLVVARIIKAAELGKDDLVIEIGSGLGVVTAEIARHVYHLIAIEIDKELLQISQEVLRDSHNISFVAEDILEADLDKIAHGRPYKIVGNLPYNISAPIIERIFQTADQPALAVIMVQKEVAERMVAKPGTKKYGSFSVYVQFHAEVKLESLVSKSSFHPWPAVSSAIVSLRPHQERKYKVDDEKFFFDLVHAAFQQRRKKLSNSLKEFNLAGAPLDLNRRPETVALEEFVALANYCYNQRQ